MYLALYCRLEPQVILHFIMIFQGARNEIFALQPAPIQVSYMGFPGTTGASYIQYLVTDEVRQHFLAYFFVQFHFLCVLKCPELLWQFVSPTRFAHIYSEKLVHLPHCYFVNDYKQVAFTV